MDERPIWGPAPAEISIPPPGEIHLWRIDQGDRLPSVQPSARDRRVEEFLSDDEIARMRRYVRDIHRHRFGARRFALRSILGRYLRIGPADVRFIYSPRGRPEIAAETSLRFNLSDSAEWALVGLAREARIGVDIERLRPIGEMDAIAESHFAPDERAAYGALSAESEAVRGAATGAASEAATGTATGASTEAATGSTRDATEPATGGSLSQRMLGFYRAWTRKEAWLKARGDGLWAPLDGFSVTLRPGDPPRLLGVRGEPGEEERWSLLSFEPAPECLAAVAIEANQPAAPTRVSCFSFD